MLTLGCYLTREVDALIASPRTKHEVWAASERVSRELQFQPPKYRYDHPVSLLLFRQIYAAHLHEDVEAIKAKRLPSPDDCWYHALISLANPPPTVALSCISIPMVYRIRPMCPVSCALVVCRPSDSVSAVFDRVLGIVCQGIGVGIEMLSTDPNLVREMERLDRALVANEGKRENFVAVNVLACHPDVEELLLRCNKSGGLFFHKINVGIWWSPKFLDRTLKSPRVCIVDRGQSLVAIKRQPEVRRAVGYYGMNVIFDAKCRGGIPYILHIEACPNYETTIYGTNLCTEVFLPLMQFDGARCTSKSQLCVLGNEDVSRSQLLTRSERRNVRCVLVDTVSSVWDRLERSDELAEMFNGLPPIDFASRPCGIGATGFFSAACDADEPYTLARVESQLTEFMDDCRQRFASLPKMPTVLFSIPPSSNSEFNMMCSPNIMHWDRPTINIITRYGNWVLLNDRHRAERLSYNDKVAIASRLDQSLSLDVIIRGPQCLADMVRYMLNGYAMVGARRVTSKTISYYTKSNVKRGDKQCTETCDL